MEYKNSDMCRAIAEHVHNEKYRELLRLRFCDGYTYDEISCATNFSAQHIKHLCKIYRDMLMNNL